MYCEGGIKTVGCMCCDVCGKSCQCSQRSDAALKNKKNVRICSEDVLENQSHQLAFQRAIAPFSYWLLSKPALQTHGVAKSIFGLEKRFLGYCA